MEIKAFVEEVIAFKNRKIINEVFLLIQKNRDFIQKHLWLVQEYCLQTVNKNIAKMVMKEYGLKPDDTVRNYEPESILTSSYIELLK